MSSKGKELKFYDFEVFKALTEIEIERINRYKKLSQFSIAFLYFPAIINLLKEKKPKDIDIIFRLKENLRSLDVISPVDEDFVFLFLPETDKKQINVLIERFKKSTDINFVEGVVSYPEDGKTAKELFNKMVQIMNEKLIPIIEIWKSAAKKLRFVILWISYRFIFARRVFSLFLSYTLGEKLAVFIN